MLPQSVRAQQRMTPTIGFLGSLSAFAVARHLVTFRQALKEAGYEDGKNVAIEYRWAEGQFGRLPELASDLVRRGVAVIATVGGDPAALAAKAATSTIPIVFMVGRSPVKFGLVESLNRPGGNATGVNFFISETEAKRIELLRELIPAASKIAVLLNPNSADADIQISDYEMASRSLGQHLQVIRVSRDTEIESAIAALAQANTDALLIAADPFLMTHRNLVVGFATRHRIPAVYPLRDFAEAGGLVSYGASLSDAYRQTGAYVGQILKGAKPGELPVVQSTKFELVINLKAAKALNLTISPMLLARADEVIE